MFRAVPPPIIRSSKLYTQHRVFVELYLTHNSLMIAVRSRKSSTNTRCCVYSFELLMMGGGTAGNRQSFYSNKYHRVTLQIIGYA